MWHSYGDPFIGPLAHSLGLGVLFPVLFVAFLVWAFAWKAIALWHAARNGQRWWFLALTIINTIGILEIVYLKWFQKSEGESRDHIFPFLKDVRHEVMSRVPTPTRSKE